MKIPIKANYAFRILMDIGINAEREITTIEYIANRQNISEKYIEYLIMILKNAGFVTINENNEYRLYMKPEEIKIGDILELMEDDYKFIEVISREKYQGEYDRIIKYQLWDEIARAVKNIIEGKTLKDMTDNYNEIYSGIFYI